MMSINPYSLPSAMAAGLTLMLGFFVLLRSPKEKLNRLFFRFTISIFVWLFIFAAGYSLKDPAHALLAFRTAYLGVVFIPVLCLHFHLEFLSIYKPVHIRILYGISCIFLLLSHSPYFFKSVKHYFWGYYPQAGPAYIYFIFFFAAVVGTSVTLLIFQLVRGHVKGDARAFKYQQLKYLALSFIMAYSGSVDFIAKFGIEFYPFGYLNISLFVMILTYAMIRHRLLDVQTMMQLFQQHKLATLGLLAAGLNHEIRNPLYIIKGSAESYLDGVERNVFKTEHLALEKSKEVFGKTIQQSDRAIDIVKRFSSFVKFSSGMGAKEEVDINLCVENVLEFLNHEISDKKIQIETFGGDSIKIHVNRREIEEVLFNIVLNACQAMGDKGKLTVNTLRQEDKCLVLIKDTGPGIPLHLRKKIFEPFYSGRMERGTGLGLYICQFLMEHNNGKIQVDSKMGSGSVFILEFLMEKGEVFPFSQFNS
jgi:signal transduction histidine kinase